jgi:hypothetical protein
MALAGDSGLAKTNIRAKQLRETGEPDREIEIHGPALLLICLRMRALQAIKRLTPAPQPC